MGKTDKALVIAESQAQVRELIAGAQELAEKTVFYCWEEGDIAAGDERLQIEGETAFVETFPSLMAYVKQHCPSVILLSNSQDCRLLAGQLGALLGTAVLVDAQSLAIDGDFLTSSRMVYGGMANRIERIQVPGAVAVVASAVFPAVQDSSEPAIVAVPSVPSPVKVTAVEEKVVENVNLAAAKTLVCVGRGFAEESELQLAHDFAQKVGGEIGCTRPISEGEGWMSSARYVGVSGLMLNPDIYFGLGISGQIQHMVGVNGARVVVAVNKDPRAPIFEQCDLGLVATVQEALPAIVQSL